MFAITCFEAQSVDKCNHFEFPSHLLWCREYRDWNHMLPARTCSSRTAYTVGQPVLPTLTLSTTPPQQIHNDVSDHALISCLFQGYADGSRGEQCNPKNRPTPFRHASPCPSCYNPPLEDSFTRVSGYWRTDHCAGAPVHMSQHDRRVSRHVCQLTFPTLCKFKRLERRKEEGGKGEK